MPPCKYYPVSVEIHRNNMAQSHQDTHSNTPKPVAEDLLPNITSQLPVERSKELCVVVKSIIKLCT